MCDYSLMTFPNRLAREGEDLILHRFTSGSMGLASPADLQPTTHPEVTARRSFWTALKEFFNPAESGCVTAVCIPPFARLTVHHIGERLQKKYGVHAEEDVTFEELSADVNTYRDAICFRNGTRVCLQDLPAGLRCTVVDLVGHDIPDAETEPAVKLA